MRNRRARPGPLSQPGPVITVAAASLLLCYLSATGIVSVLRSVTTGERVADVVVGVLLVALPGLLVLSAAHVLRRRGRSGLCSWYLAALWAPALTLLPYFKGVDVDPGLVHMIDEQLPGLTAGLAAGELVVLVGGACLGIHKLRLDETDDRRRAGRGRRAALRARRRPRF